ncbi:DUF4878 domain-containing protein [Breznakiellaceae bacterium SP9]
MGKYMAIAFVTAFAFIAVGCSSGSSPTTVVKDFCAALEKSDFDKAKTFATAETGALLDTIKSMTSLANLGGETATNEMADAFAQFKNVTFGTETISGDTATVIIKDAEGSENTIDLVKQNGTWKVKMSK